MSSQQERIYFIGGTGGVGSKAVQDVLAQEIPITIYTRQPEKSNYKGQPNVTLVRGDYDDLNPFEKSVAGHTLLFLLVEDLSTMAHIKGSLAKVAYAAGVKQIVDIPSLTIEACPFTFIGQAHLRSEEVIRAASSQKDYSFLCEHPTLAFHDKSSLGPICYQGARSTCWLNSTRYYSSLDFT